MVTVGIIGMGMMGRTHFEAYQTLPGVKVLAICDENPDRAAGNLAGTGGNVLKDGIDRIDMSEIFGSTDYRELLRMPELQAVDICAFTPAHLELATAALEAGKHVLCEKPLARSAVDGRSIVAAAAMSPGIFMPAMCLRFWPEWAWAKAAVAEKRFGRVLGATFRRVASMPAGWYSNGILSGGALLDLHIHDTDFVQHLFGKPSSVFSRGYSKTSGEVDHLVTHYFCQGVDAPPLVVAEGSWCLANGFDFQMKFTLNCEQATIDYDFARGPDALRLSRDGKTETIACPNETGYVGELRYFTDCIRNGTKPTIVTGQDAVDCLDILEAERQSVLNGQVVAIPTT